jgi:hypothetical protein
MIKFLLSILTSVTITATAAFAMDPPENTQESNVPTLRKLAADAIFHLCKEDAEKGIYETINKYRDFYLTDLQDLIFSHVYKPKSNDTPNLKFMGFMTNVDLSDINESGTLGKIISTNSTYLTPLSESHNAPA